MSNPPSPHYRPLWLTDEEHQRIFGELLANPEGLKEERLADILTKADARSKDAAPAAMLAARRMFFVTAAGLAIITFIGVLASILVRH